MIYNSINQVSSGKEVENVELKIYLINGNHVVINISSDSFTDDALEVNEIFHYFK